MKDLLKKTINIFLITSLLFVNLYVQKVEASSKTFGDVKRELQEFKEKYENNQLEQQLTEQERENIKKNISATEAKIAATQTEIYNLGLEIDALNADIEEKEKEIAAILSFYQVSSGESVYLEYAFGAKNFTDFIYRLAVSEQLTSYNTSLVEQFKADIEESKKKTLELSQKITDLENEQVKLEADLIKIASELDELSDDAISIEREIELAESQVNLFEKMGCKDSETIEECARNTLPPDTSFWRPLERGYITGWPGPRILSGIEGGTFHHGLDMSSNGAAYIDYPIYSVANGIVIGVYDERTCGGRKVYIQHNVNGVIYVSAYWHLRRIDVEKDQVVTKDTVIGIMGGTESWDKCTTGAHLHLELSTAKFNSSNYYSTRSEWLYPQNFINFPKSKYVEWYDRYTKF